LLMKSVYYRGEELRVIIGRYADNNNLAVMLETLTGEHVATLSANTVKLPPDEFVVKNWSENAELAEAMRPHFHDTGKRVTCGYVRDVPVWKLDDREAAHKLAMHYVAMGHFGSNGVDC
jgi:hypothetical protein